MERKQFVIDRSQWRCGGLDVTDEEDEAFGFGKGATRLLNPEGFMCCLGQVGCQLGFTKAELFNASTPYDLGLDPRFSMLVMPGHDGKATGTELANAAMNINDDHELDTDTREARLTALFREHGYELAFVGEYVQP